MRLDRSSLSTKPVHQAHRRMPHAAQARLEAMGSHYGALPAHDALWHSAEATAHSLPARLAVEHCVHEARGYGLLA